MRKFVLIASVVVASGLATAAWCIGNAHAEARKAVVGLAIGNGQKREDLVFSRFHTSFEKNAVCGLYSYKAANGELTEWHPFVVLFQRGSLPVWQDPLVLEPVDPETRILAESVPGGTNTLQETLGELDRLTAVRRAEEGRRFAELAMNCVPDAPRVRS